MNPTIKKQWLEALRSGKYQQGKGRLRMKHSGVDRFCCLGVLCDLLEPAGWVLHPNNPEVFLSGIHEGYPQDKVRDKAGIERDQCQTLAAMNDSGKSFEEIAQTIENTL
jgi:hypothetical protein